MRTLARIGRGFLLALLATATLLGDGTSVRALPHAWQSPPVDCTSPADSAQAAICVGYEQAILNATVLLRVISRCRDRPEGELWRFDSHATILDDHTLQTHNHYRILGDERCELVTVILYAPDGAEIAVLLDANELARVERQLDPVQESCSMETCTLVLDRPFLNTIHEVRVAYYDPEMLEEQVAGWSAVAEINWRGSPGSTYVQWTRIKRLSSRGEVPVLELADGILEGSSGGGVWVATTDGVVQIGNCWRRRVDSTGSVAALNPQ